jgi:hypothetical protein
MNSDAQFIQAYDAFITTAKSAFSSDFLTGNILSVSDSKIDHSFFAYDEVSADTTETVRESHDQDDDGSGKVTVGVLYNDTSSGSAEQRVFNCMDTRPEKTVISTIRGSQETTTTLNGAISWSRDDSALYLGTFRVRYTPASGGEPAKLCIENFDNVSGQYLAVTEFESV